MSREQRRTLTTAAACLGGAVLGVSIMHLASRPLIDGWTVLVVLLGIALVGVISALDGSQR